MKEHLFISLRLTAVLLVITCGIYPGLIWAVGQTVFRNKANGSLVVRDGRIVGSALIGQEFTSDRFFHSRPSAANYDGSASGGSNLGPTSKKLRDAVAAAITAYDMHRDVPPDAVTASGSGLDPHISPENALAQAERVAKTNGLPLQVVQQMIEEHTEGRFLSIYGEPRVNVLALNLDLMARAKPRV